MKKSEMMLTLEQPEICKMSPCYYNYPNSVVLKNKYGITDLLKLEERHAHDAAKEAVNLLQEPNPERFDSSYLKYLHSRLFQHTFEWAGCTRDVPFTFSDGTTAIMLNMSKSDSDVKFASGRKIEESLKLFDLTLAQKNNLQGLSRKEFVHDAAKLFAAINYIHPFREGNGRTQRVFFVKLARAAGHRLDFSAVTKKRMTYVSLEAIKNRDIGPLEDLFEDISNLSKVRILKRFIKDMKAGAGDSANLQEKLIVVAKEDTLYEGVCKFLDLDRVVVETENAYVICSRDSLTPEQLRVFKLGDKVAFKVLNPKEIFIPGEKLANLTQYEITKKLTEHISVQAQQNKIQHYARFVYGNADELNGVIRMIRITPSLARMFAKQIAASSAESYDNKVFSIKNFIRKKSNRSENFCKLVDAVENYASVVKAARNEILKEHQERQKRCEQVVKMPSKTVQRFLDIPENMWQEALKSEALLLLNGDLCDFMNKVNSRLSSCECRAINNNNYEELAKSINISVSKAKEITEVVRKVKELQRQLRVVRMGRLNTTDIAC
ncbi:BID domain-containing T4SS effector [Bartonella bilalgolemii]|uniref:protein adenylyltransferase n=1 Tax=Bartonella bilalgolemii TaxID=2942911 RepID=A0ABT0PAJ2_9HYPH|nr:BID domain-containing T4SS effector [Bartonella sp. G70]MCL6230267.1 BID domain-containing T4SS effector [Bartonella sp. G70]